MGGTTRWPHAEALAVAEELRGLLEPHCERIEIAGSLRRQKPDVGDIELLCVPKPAESIWHTDALDAALSGLMGDGVLNFRLNGRGSRTYGPLNKYLTHLASGIAVDVFSTDLDHWGAALLIRTGPKEMNVRMMTRCAGLGFKGYVYGIRNRQGEDMAVPDEESVFRLLGWDYVPPEQRVS